MNSDDPEERTPSMQFEVLASQHSALPSQRRNQLLNPTTGGGSSQSLASSSDSKHAFSLLDMPQQQ